jgi:Domain of unknown function (DUF4326)
VHENNVRLCLHRGANIHLIQDARKIPRLTKMRRGLLEENPSHVYIGRAFKKNGYNLEASKWGNPFVVGKDGLHSLQDVLARYERHVLRNPLLMDSLSELKGMTLVCWCHPKPCHGQVLINLFKKHVK